jgi:integrase
MPAIPETVASYIAECAGRLKPGSIQRRLNAIAEAHKAAGLDSPTHTGIIRNTMKGIRRTLGTAPVRKAPALTDDIRAMVAATNAGIIGARDRALILLGFAGAFRRSELVGLDASDCTFGKDGLTITLRTSKTDQEGAGRRIGIPFGSNPETCPVRTMQAWIVVAGITEGPVLRAAAATALVRYRRSAGSEETDKTGRAGFSQVCRALATGRARYQRRHCRRFGAEHYESDGAQERPDGTAVYPGRELVPREQRR